LVDMDGVEALVRNKLLAVARQRQQLRLEFGVIAGLVSSANNYKRHLTKRVRMSWRRRFRFGNALGGQGHGRKNVVHQGNGPTMEHSIARRQLAEVRIVFDRPGNWRLR